MQGQLDEDIKKQRANMIMELQRKIVQEQNSKFVGKTYKVIIDEIYDDYVVARTYMDVIEVDTVIYVDTKLHHNKGDFINVKIVDVLDYDLKAVEV